MNEPADLAAHRRTVLRARLDRAHRLLVLVESNSRSNAESVAELRHFAEIMGAESEQGRDALAFADRIARDTSLLRLGAAVAEELRTVRAELDCQAGTQGG